MSHTTPPTLLYLQSINPVKFEHYVADLFKSEGYKVTTTSVTGDEGVDLYIRKNDEFAVVQCKRFIGSVGPTIIRDLYGTMMHEHANKAYLVTTGKFTRKTKDWAIGKPIELIDGDQLEKWAKRIYDRNALAEARKLKFELVNNASLSKDTEIEPKIIKIPMIGVAVVLLLFVALYTSPRTTSRTTEPTMTRRTVVSPTRTVLPTSDPGLGLDEELLNVEGVQQIASLNTVKSSDGYSMFVNATVNNGYVDGDVAKEMLSISENLFNESFFQFVVFLEDDTRAVTFVWSKAANRWSLSNRDN